MLTTVKDHFWCAITKGEIYIPVDKACIEICTG